MTLAADVLDRAEELTRKRLPRERVLLDTLKYALPVEERFFAHGTAARQEALADAQEGEI